MCILEDPLISMVYIHNSHLFFRYMPAPKHLTNRKACIRVFIAATFIIGEKIYMPINSKVNK